MASTITRKTIDKCRQALKTANPHSDAEISLVDKDEDEARIKATFAKNVLEHYGLSLTDPNDYGNITE